MNSAMLQAATDLINVGISVVPADGQKRPLGRWKECQKKIMGIAEAPASFRNEAQLAAIGGAVSGNLEVIDIDNAALYEPFKAAVELACPSLLSRCYQEKSPNAFHIAYRCAVPVPGNTKLAADIIPVDGPGEWPCPWKNGNKKYKAIQSNGKWVIEVTSIETRGEGGYCLVAPSNGYAAVSGSMLNLPVITAEERQRIINIGGGFNKKRERAREERPWEQFDAEVYAGDLLVKHGWKPCSKIDGLGQTFTRPGKSGGVSGVVYDDTGLTHIFTSNASPLEMGKTYTPSALYTLLEHNGDFSAAARQLAEDGFGGEKHEADQQDEEWEPDIKEWPVLPDKAMYGLAGEFVRLATRSSEADPAAVLATFLVRVGVEFGNDPTLHVGDTMHKARLAAVVVGDSSKSRKGTSGKPILRLFEQIEPKARYTPGPFSSGEGIISAVRDKVERWNDKDQAYVVVDLGESDKRLFVLDEEFAGAMAQTKREGNTLSMVIRNAWDNGNLDPLTKTSKIKATNAHVGWVSHITLFELNTRLDEAEGFNGFANRILWVCARRSKIVPWPEPMPDDELSQIRMQLVSILERAQEKGFHVLKWSAEAKQAWCSKYYADLTRDNQGLVGCVINRAEAQVVRLAMIYCLLDGSDTISLEHLEASLAFWSYCEQSARFIFHGRQRDQVAQRILNALASGPMTSTEIHRLFDSHVSRERIETSLSELSAAGRVVHEKLKTKGRPVTLWKLQTPCVKSVISVKRPPNQEEPELNTHNTLNTQGMNEKTGQIVEVEI